MVRKKRNRRLILVSRLLAASGIVVLGIGIGVAYNQYKHGQSSGLNSPLAASQNQPSTTQPNEDEFKNHQTSPDAPRYISIPALSVKAMVKAVGLTSDNRIAAPANVYVAGWYTDSAKPGQAGAMFIDGHVSSWDTLGVFYNLKKLQQGDEIHVERGDGAIFNYKVIKSQTYEADKVDMQAALAPINPDKPGLNLMSCAGQIIDGTNQFDERIVVFTQQVN